MIHPNGTSILLTPTGKVATSSDCCCEITCDEVWSACGIASSDIEITLTGWADETCSGCDQVNDIYLLDSSAFTGGSCGKFIPSLTSIGTFPCPPFASGVILFSLTIDVVIVAGTPHLQIGFEVTAGETWEFNLDRAMSDPDPFCEGTAEDINGSLVTGSSSCAVTSPVASIRAV